MSSDRTMQGLFKLLLAYRLRIIPAGYKLQIRIPLQGSYRAANRRGKFLQLAGFGREKHPPAGLHLRAVLKQCALDDMRSMKLKWVKKQVNFALQVGCLGVINYEEFC